MTNHRGVKPLKKQEGQEGQKNGMDLKSIICGKKGADQNQKGKKFEKSEINKKTI